MFVGVSVFVLLKELLIDSIFLDRRDPQRKTSNYLIKSVFVDHSRRNRFKWKKGNKREPPEHTRLRLTHTSVEINFKKSTTPPGSDVVNQRKSFLFFFAKERISISIFFPVLLFSVTSLMQAGLWGSLNNPSFCHRLHFEESLPHEYSSILVNNEA